MRRGCEAARGGQGAYVIGDIAIIRVDPSSASLLDRVADGVFNDPIDPALLRAYLAQASTLLAVALDGDLVVGQVKAAQHWHPDKPTDLYVDELIVSPLFRRRGVARALLAAVEDWARERGCADVWLATDEANREAQRLYDGFAHSRRCRLYYWDL